MSVVLVLARVALAVVFVVSGVAKLRDRAGSRAAVGDFGVPAALRPAVAAGLPFAELACALLVLLADPWASTGSVLSVVLLLAFTAAIVANLARGRHPECHCFGSGSGRIGWSSVTRNAALVVLAALPLTGTGSQRWIPGEIADMTGNQRWAVLGLAVGGAVIAVLSTVTWNLLSRYGDVLDRLEELEQLTGLAERPAAPTFSLPGLDGGRVALADELADGMPVLLAFVSPTCHNCTDLLPDLERWQSDGNPLHVLVTSEGTADAVREKVAGQPGLQVLLDSDREVSNGYQIEGTPAAVLIGGDGRVAGRAAYGADAVRALYEQTSAQLAPHGGHDHSHEPQLHEIGQRPVDVDDPLPEAILRDEHGVEIPAASVAQDERVFVFWRTDCGFCAQILDDVRALQDDGALVLISGSPVAEVRAAGLTAPLYSEPTGQLENALGVPGTPSAVGVRGGRLTTAVAVGGPDVLALLRSVPSAAV